MQPVLTGPRLLKPEAVVRELLQSHRTLQIQYGADALDSDFNVVADISEYMTEGSTITSNLNSSIHRVCALSIDSDATSTGWSYLSGFVRPFMVLRDPESGDEARFNLGVYTLPSPSVPLGVSPATIDFAGYDLIYLLKQPIGDSFYVPAGAEPIISAATAIGLAIPNASVDWEPSDVTLPKAMVWPFDPENPTTWYEVVTTLLNSVAYTPVWVDWEGHFQLRPFVDLQKAAVEWTFDLEASDNIVSEERSQEVDLFAVPNWWRFVVADLDDSPVEGVTQFTWEDTSAANPGSLPNRKRRIKHIEAVPAANFERLRTYSERRIAATLAPGETFDVTTQPFPLAWHLDVIDYRDPNLGPSLPQGLPGRRKVVAVEWVLPLDGQTDMTWVWRTISEQTAAVDLTVVEEG